MLRDSCSSLFVSPSLHNWSGSTHHDIFMFAYAQGCELTREATMTLQVHGQLLRARAVLRMHCAALDTTGAESTAWLEAAVRWGLFGLATHTAFKFKCASCELWSSRTLTQQLPQDCQAALPRFVGLPCPL